MKYRDFKFGEAEKKEIIECDILYRVNACKNGKTDILLNRESSYIEDNYQQVHTAGFLDIDHSNHYKLTEKGKARLTEYGKMYQKFRDLAIFKCVYPEAPGPEYEGEPDERFGTYEEYANPPQSEDYRIAIFENFAQRMNRQAPLHIVAFFAMVESRDIRSEDEDWIWELATGELFTFLKEVLDEQVSAEAIAPDGFTPDEIIDEIYRAGMQEMKRSMESEEGSFSHEQMQEDDEEVWVEEVEYDDDDDDDFFYRGPHYYDPYYDYNVGVGAAVCVGAFAGLATCALLL